MTAAILITEQVDIPGFVADAGVQVSYQPDLWKSDALADQAEHVECLVVRNRTQVTSDLLARCKRLKVVGRLGAGLDNIDVQAAAKRGVSVVYAPDSNTVAVAEYCLAQTLLASRKLYSANLSTHAGAWDRNGHMGRELKELNVGIVGYGRIGQRLAQMMNHLGARVIAASAHLGAAKHEFVRFVSIEQLFAQSDVVSIHVAATASTRGLVNARLLQTLRPDAIFINTSRGDVVDEQALQQAVDARPDCTFILDVRLDEPPKDRRFAAKTNVILSPHIAAFAHAAQQSVAQTVFRDVLTVLQGGTPLWPAAV